MASIFKFDFSQLDSNILKLPEKVDRFVGAAFQRQADVSTTYMKQNATWTDRTGNARNSLHAIAQKEGSTHVLTLAHGMPYGFWLEVRFGGRYAIIIKAVAQGGSDIMRLLEKGLTRI